MTKFSKYAALILILSLVCTAACTGRANGNAVPGNPAAIDVVVTFDALYGLAEAIAGDRANVIDIMPPGADAHHFEPKAKDIAVLNNADVFLVCGLGLDPWAENAASAAGNEKLIVCVVSKGIVPIALSGGGDTANSDSDDSIGEGGDPDAGAVDPHVWLSPVCAKAMAENIRDTLTEADPGGADIYRRNSDELLQRLTGLYNEYSEKFSSLERKTIVTSHAVFAYLCRDFGLIQNSVEGVFADGEPNALALTALIEFCRANDITTILTESQSSPLIAQTLASEAGAGVSVIYTMESEEDGLGYIERMEHNLATIYESLR